MAGLTEQQAELLLGKNIAHLATIRKDGTPHVTPVWVDWDGEHVLVNTAQGRAKERNMRRDPRVALEISNAANPYDYISITGTAELTTEGADEHIDKLAKKYTGADTYRNRRADEQRVLVRVRPERVDGGFSRRSR